MRIIVGGIVIVLAIAITALRVGLADVGDAPPQTITTRGTTAAVLIGGLLLGGLIIGMGS